MSTFTRRCFRNSADVPHHLQVCTDNGAVIVTVIKGESMSDFKPSTISDGCHVGLVFYEGRKDKGTGEEVATVFFSRERLKNGTVSMEVSSDIVERLWSLDTPEGYGRINVYLPSWWEKLVAHVAKTVSYDFYRHGLQVIVSSMERQR